MTFQFKMFKDVEVPEVVRQGGGARVYEFPFGDVPKAKKNKDSGKLVGDGFFIPREFWVTEAGLTDEHIDKKAEGGKASGAQDLRERVKRAFGTWQMKHDPDKKLKLVIADVRDKDTNKYLGANVWKTDKDVGAALAKKTAAAKTAA